MQINLFIGSNDKTDLIFYLAKILTGVGQRVLIVDHSRRQCYREWSPAVDQKYILWHYNGVEILQFDEIVKESDQDYLQILHHYFLKERENIGRYDYIFIDTDQNPQNWREVTHHFMISSYERGSLNLDFKLMHDWLSGNKEKITLKLILYHVNCMIDQRYILHHLEQYPVMVEDRVNYIPLDEQFYSLKVNNQHQNKISLRGLSPEFRDVLANVIHIIAQSVELKEVRKAIKKI